MNHAGTGTPTHIGRNSLTGDDLRVRADGRAGGTGGNGGGTHIPCPACGLRYPPHRMHPLPPNLRLLLVALPSDTPVCPACHYDAAPRVQAWGETQRRAHSVVRLGLCALVALAIAYVVGQVLLGGAS